MSAPYFLSPLSRGLNDVSYLPARVVPRAESILAFLLLRTDAAWALLPPLYTAYTFQ